MREQYYVYIHVDKVTGLVIYCGKGSENGYYDRAYDIKKRPYKIDDTLEVFKVKYFDNEKEAFVYEEFLTSFYKKCGQCWYNNDIGNKRSEETKQKLSEGHKGKHHSEETKKRMSEAKKGKYTGELSPMYGKHLSEETKKKISEVKKGKYTRENSPNYGKTGTKNPNFKGYVYCPELDMTFVGTRDAEQKCKAMGIKVGHQHISQVINGKRKYNGFIIRDGEKVALTWERTIKNKKVLTNIYD